MTNAVLAWIIARLKEPSTYAGLGGVVATMSFLPHASADATIVVQVGGLIASALAIALPEAASK